MADGLTRRHFFGRAAAMSAGMTLGTAAGASALEPAPAPAESPAAAGPAGTIPVSLTVNGSSHSLQLDPRVTLLDALRERLNLTGTKKGCDRGQCGACTVHVDGRRVLSCLTLAAATQGQAITTVEGIASGGALTPVQQAFVDNDGMQCGFCTSGQVMSATALLTEGQATTADEIREWMSGNICRCGCYPNIVAAVTQARGA